MKPWHYIMIAAAVVIGYLVWSRGRMQPAQPAAFNNGNPPDRTPAIGRALATIGVARPAAPPIQATGPGPVSQFSNNVGAVAGTVAKNACLAAGGGPLCGAAGGVAGSVAKVGTQAVVGVAKAGAAVVSKLKFW